MKKTATNYPLIVLKLFAQFVIIAVILFLSAGTLLWQMGWMVIGLYFLVLIGSLAFIRMDDDFIENRTRIDARTKGWDKVLAGFLRIVSPVGLLIIAGLDHRLHWSPGIPLSLQYLALLTTSIGYGISIWAVSANRFYSGFVRIGGEKEHAVVQSGPYQFIRHPGYAGSILVHLGIPVALGSIWAFVIGTMASILVVLRTSLEDRSLIEELTGYGAYAEKVRFRLFPGLW